MPQTTSSIREIRLIAAVATACGSLGAWASSIVEGAEWIAWTMALVACWLLAVGATAAFRTTHDPIRPTSLPGLALPSVAYGAAVALATWGTMPILTRLIERIGPAAAPTTVFAILCGTAGLLVAGRIVDVSIDPMEHRTPATAVVHEEEEEGSNR